MGEIKFEVVEGPKPRSRSFGLITNWVDKVVKLAREHEGKTLAIDLASSKDEFGGKPFTSVYATIANLAHRSIGQREALIKQGFTYTIRGSRTETPILYIKYVKPTKEGN